MDQYNLILIAFIVASFFLALWWAFNTIRRIDQQKNYCAMELSSLARLWHRAKFVPEDAKDRESLYLYRDFLRKFEEHVGQYPVMVKDGKVRCMNRKEYDHLNNQKTIRPVSILVSILSIMIAGAAFTINFYFNKTYGIGIGLAVILPLTQLFLAFFVRRSAKDKDKYRDGIFLALKENSVAFLSITKPFIIVDAYPDKFGKNKAPLYAALGTLTDQQINETRDYILRQKAAETKTVMVNVENTLETLTPNIATTDDEITVENPNLATETPTNDEPTIKVPEPATEPTPTEVVPEPIPAAPVTPSEPEMQADNLPEMSTEEMMDLVNDFIDNTLQAEITQAEQEFAQAQATANKNEPVITATVAETTEPTPVEPVTEVTAPAEDDFSLEAIGQALDAEIARRKKNGR